MKHLPCVKQYVLGQPLKAIITMTNNLTETIVSNISASSFDTCICKALVSFVATFKTWIFYLEIRITPFKLLTIQIYRLQ